MNLPCLPFTVYRLPIISYCSLVIDNSLKIDNLPAGRQSCKLIIAATKGAAL